MEQPHKIVPYLNVPLANSFFTIDTRQGIKGDAQGLVTGSTQSPYDININKNESLFAGRFYRVQLTELNMPFVTPNVTPYNNILYLINKASGLEASVVIAPKSYNPDDLITAIKEQLNASSGIFNITTWDITYNSSLSQFTISTSAIPPPGEEADPTKQFIINPKIGVSKGTYNYRGTDYARTSTLADMMGFVTYQNYDVSQTSLYASLMFTNYIDITSNQLARNQTARDSSTSNITGQNLIARVYLSENLAYNPNLIKETITNSKIFKWSPNEYLANLDIQVRDEFGNFLWTPATNNTISLPGAAPQPSGSTFVQMTFVLSEVIE